MADRCVPVHMGSPEFEILEIEGFRITHAWFPPGLVLEPHVHERTIFAVMLEGSFEDVFRQRAFDCTPSTVFTEPAGERHANNIQKAGAEVLVVQPDHEREDLLHPCRDLLERVHHFRHGGIADLAARVAREVRTPDPATPLGAEGLVLEMLAVAARVDEAGLVDGEIPAWLDRAREIVHDRFAEGPTIGEIADEVGVHPVTLSRAFRERYRTPIGEYLRKVRARWAAERLLETDTGLSSIALRAGYADQSHFTREFKKYAGLTPGRYRAVRSESVNRAR